MVGQRYGPWHTLGLLLAFGPDVEKKWHHGNNERRDEAVLHDTYSFCAG